uniref:Histone deacetylase 14 n=1 Tax=Tanacetum cinerariifolium TaxID=118510 RepID=A0A699HQH9_TANCI|nr:hypothetical protein [Tanacetum cinerariifolium]
MADVNVNAPTDQAPTMAPPTHTNDQILPHIRWVPIGKSNCYLDVESKHKFHSRPDSPLHLPNEEPVLGYLKFSAKGTKREVFGMPIPNKLITVDIQGEPYYKEYLEKVASIKDILTMGLNRFFTKGSDPDSPALKPAKATKKSKLSAPKADLMPPPSPARRSKRGLVTKRRKPTSSLRSVDESVDEGIPEKEPKFDDEEVDVQRALEESLKSVYDAPRGPLPLVVIREPDSGKYQPLPETPKKKSPADQSIFQRRTSTPTESSSHDESSSLYVELGLTDSEVESDEDVPGIDAEVQDEGHAGSNPDPEQMDEGFTATAYPNVQENLKQIVEEHVILEEPAISTGTLSSLQHLAKDLSFDLPEADMKEILHQQMWETNSYKAHEDHMMLYEALEKSMNHDHTDELIKDLAEARKKKKKRRDSLKMPPGSPPYQPPPPLPPAGQSHGSTTPSSSKITSLVEYKAWITTDTRIKPSISSTSEDLHMDVDMAPNAQVHSSDDEDIKNAHIPKNNWASALASAYLPPPEDSLLAMNQLLTDSVDGSIIRHNVSKPLPLGGPPGQTCVANLEDERGLDPDVGLEQMVPDQMWIEEKCKYDIAAMYGISHWWFQRKQFYIDRHTSEGDRKAVRTHIQILSVVKIEVFSMYGYAYIKKIVLHRADLNEHIIVERDFKYLYPSDFKDLYLLNLQGHLNHLPPKDKKILTAAVNLWTRHLVIRQHVEDFLLGIESYQT